jgi:hypothetical protein
MRKQSETDPVSLNFASKRKNIFCESGAPYFVLCCQKLVLYNFIHTVPLNTVTTQSGLFWDQSVAWLGHVGSELVLYFTLHLSSTVTHFPSLNKIKLVVCKATFPAAWRIQCYIKGMVTRDFGILFNFIGEILYEVCTRAGSSIFFLLNGFSYLIFFK